ncbi:MAG TPA: FHA domain-containing protein [Gammaproteobacteria bacterium]
MLTALRSFTHGLRRPWPLRLELRGHWEVFSDEQDYDRFLTSRIEVPAESIERLAGLDSHGVQRQLRHTRRSHKNAVDILVRALETRQRLRYLWGMLDVDKVPDEQDWPSILFAVGSSDRISDNALRLTLTHYIHYLESRRDLLETLGREYRAGLAASAGAPVVPRAMRSEAAPVSFRFTTRLNKHYARLPRRRAVNLDLNLYKDIVIYLARNRFTLRLVEGQVVLQQQDGVSYEVRPGRTMVGRSAQCEISVDSAGSDVSRQHLLIEMTVEHHLRLTDVSSRGTYLPPELLERVDTGTKSNRMH